MRLALIATTVAGVAALPFAVAVTGPQMSSEEFLSAVRCTAYEDVFRGDAELREARYHLNAEARRQPAETAAQARVEVKAIALQAVNARSGEETAMLRRERADACSGARLATDAEASRPA
jgi:hypothetical protein